MKSNADGSPAESAKPRRRRRRRQKAVATAGPGGDATPLSVETRSDTGPALDRQEAESPVHTTPALDGASTSSGVETDTDVPAVDVAETVAADVFPSTVAVKTEPVVLAPTEVSEPALEASSEPVEGETEPPAPATEEPEPPKTPKTGSPSWAGTAGTGKAPALGQILLEQQLVTSEQLTQAMDRQSRTRRRLGRVLVEMGFATAEAVLEALSAQLGVPSTRVNSYTVNAEAVQCLPEKVARKHMAFPLLKVGSTLVVAIASPKNLHALDDLRFAAGCGIQTMVALETEIQSALDKYYGNRFGGAEAEETGAVVIDVPGPQLDLHDEVAERSASSLVDRVIARAAADRASDVHLEPMKNSLRVRFRIDGTFNEVAHLLLALSPAVLARIKVLSGMDIAEHRLPQDGRFSATVGGRGLDVRTSTYPTIWGEKAVLRLLDRTRLQLSLDGIMTQPTLGLFRGLLTKPEGIILVTGPTGSGKTSTLYASLAELAETGKNIITIEDPVEYWLPGVNQGQTNHKAGFDFSRGLRAILRQDPDVIMVGEIRDTETMATAIEAALTGHLVLSTLHTNSAIATVTRLLEMGVEPYLLASAVAGVLAQSLVRKICETCKEPIDAPAAMRPLFGANPPAKIYRGMGCQDCRGTGFLGRLGIFELLVLSDETRRLMHENASEARLLETAKREGMHTLREECLIRVKDGSTTLEEVIRVTMARSPNEEENDEEQGDQTPPPAPKFVT